MVTSKDSSEAYFSRIGAKLPWTLLFSLRSFFCRLTVSASMSKLSTGFFRISVLLLK